MLRDDTVTIGSFDFAESELLAELYGHALRDAGYEVDVEHGLGARELVAPAMGAGLVELLPEYLGTALEFLSLGDAEPGADPDAAHDALVVALADLPVRVLASAPAQDANAFVATRATAARYGLRTLSDLASAAPFLTFGGPPECRFRPLCLPGLEDRYGVTFRSVLELDTGGPLTHQALEQGQVDVALLFTTDPDLDDFVVLEDDAELQPAENVTPLVREEVVDRWGTDLVAVVDAVSADLSTATLRRLNAEVARADGDAAAVAARWLAAR